VIYILFAEVAPAVALTDTDAHPEYMIPITPDSVEEDDLTIKIKVRLNFEH